MTASRRIVIAGGLAAIAGCRDWYEKPANVRPGKLAALRDISPVPIGCCVTTRQLHDAGAVKLLVRNFSQITPEYEMKMNLILAEDGRLRFGPADKIVAFAQAHAMRVHGHTLIWHKSEPAYFTRLKDDRARFEAMYRSYIGSVVSRYRGRIAGWDVVNEPISPKGDGLRASLWSRVLGQEDHIRIAFEAAHETDPNMIGFINDFRLESLPEKRRRFMALVERQLSNGTKIGGIGTQSHLRADLPKGHFKAAIADLASFGLPIHISELDISFGLDRVASANVAEKRDAQARIIDEVCEAFIALPSKQRYAITLWGLRDSDSWLLRPPFDGSRNDEPLLFDRDGLAKPLLAEMIAALKRGRNAGKSR